ncbi:MAG: ribonuclease P protein component 1 [Candidatus Nanoarchaeia archaeon]
MIIKDIKKDELIGLHITIVDATNPCLNGINGKVVDETKNTLVVENHKRITLLKNQIIIECPYKGRLLRIDGKKLVKRPEDRVKER